MSVEPIAAPPAARPRRRHIREAGPSTSIRVPVATHDILAAEAAAAGLSLTAYVERLARQAERERIFAEFRAAQEQAYSDPDFVQEMMEWESMDDGIEFDDDWADADWESTPENRGRSDG